MDRLSSERQESLKKTSTERLRLKVVRAGIDEEKVMEMDREALLGAVAMLIAKEQLEEAAQVPLPTEEAGSSASDESTEGVRHSPGTHEKLEIEERRWLREERRAEREAEMRRMEIEAEERRAEREVEARKAEREAEAEERRAE